MSGSVVIRFARPGDVSEIVRLIRELAEYEKLLDQVRATEKALLRDLFGKFPKCFAIVSEFPSDSSLKTANGLSKLSGYALFFESYSTFWCNACLYLEDLYVTPSFRGKGIGKKLLARVAAEAEARNCPRLDWNVLDWNHLAIEFYEHLGATLLPEWRTCRLEGESLQLVAKDIER